MCGIAGIISSKKIAMAKWAKSMADSLKHRGPDDEGYLSVDVLSSHCGQLTGEDSVLKMGQIKDFATPSNMILAHRRLSIIDLSPMGHQPMSYNDENLWIVYNGEIYNYIELRTQLKQSGYHFISGSDTEVLLAAYQEWGEDCVKKINGMWAFVIYDKKRNKLFGSRDRFGVKPLFYFSNPEYFAFASEVKALLQLPFISRTVNHSAVFDYLVLGRDDSEGLIEAIIELPPSFSFRLDLASNHFERWQYYTLPINTAFEDFEQSKFDAHVANIKGLLTEAIKIRLRSDVPIGSTLSGGLDSSSIIALMSQILSQTYSSDPIKAFTGSFPSNPYDESKWAQMVADTANVAWHKTFPTAQEFINDLEDFVRLQDYPFYSTAVYAQYRVMRLAKEQGVKVILGGQGGDELFAGYPLFYPTLLIELMKHQKWGHLFKELRMLENSPTSFKQQIQSILRFHIVSMLPKKVFSDLYLRSLPFTRLLNQDFLREQGSRLNIFRDNLDRSLNHHLRRHMGKRLNTLLRYEDRNSMAHSIEARLPFSDDLPLIEYIFNLPATYKIHNGWSKALLRNAMEGILTEKILRRKDKVGFITPEYQWLREQKDVLRNYVTGNLANFIDMKLILRDWDKIFSKESANGPMDLWRIINLGIWYKLNLESNF